MLLVSSARFSMRRMTSEVLVPRLSKSLAVRSLRSAGTRTWIRLLVVFDFVARVFIVILYYIVIHASIPFGGVNGLWCSAQN